MKSHHSIIRNPTGGSTALKMALLSVLALGRTGKAQQVLIPPPTVSVTPPALQQFETNQLGYIQPPESAPELAPPASPFEYGPLVLRPYAAYRFFYADGIQTSPGTAHSTFVNEFSPGIRLDIGRHWALDYMPTWRFYSNDRFEDTLDHNARLTGWTAYEDWIFGLSQSYLSMFTPLVETAQQTDLTTYTTVLNASYRFNSKLSLDMALKQEFADVSADKNNQPPGGNALAGYKDWSSLNWLNYQFWPRLEGALGIGAGYVKEQVGADMAYQQLQGRVNWRATDKLSLQGRAGLDYREFAGGDSKNLVNPVFGLSIQYLPAETTMLSLNADRTVGTSYFENQATENTEVSGRLNQRLLGKLFLDAGGGFRRTTYEAAQTGLGTSRTDDRYFLNVQLSCAFLKRGTVAAFYEYSENCSDQAGFAPGTSAYAYSSSQVGFKIGFHY